MKLEIWQDFSDRLDQAHSQALKLQFGVKELWTMYRNVQTLLRLASIEMVECRRRKKPTGKQTNDNNQPVAGGSRCIALHIQQRKNDDRICHVKARR